MQLLHWINGMGQLRSCIKKKKKEIIQVPEYKKDDSQIYSQDIWRFEWHLADFAKCTIHCWAASTEGDDEAIALLGENK